MKIDIKPKSKWVRLKTKSRHTETESVVCINHVFETYSGLG